MAVWPIPIPIIGLTGEKWSGKTLFGLTIDPKNTLVYDTEKSSETYQTGLGFTRIDVMAEMLKRYPKGHKPVDRFQWWLDHVRSVPAGKYTVIVCDTVNEIESGLADWVEAHPEHFGHTREQYRKMSGLKWQDVKDYWLSIIAADLSSRCESFVFVTHMGDVWADGKPTGKRRPKGKETLFQLASLYLQMERKKDAKGALPKVPAAVVLKERLSAFSLDEKTGEVTVRSVLPPRLPSATPAAIRWYVNNPPDYGSLAKEERAPEEAMSDDERAEVRLRTAEAEAEAERLRLERQERQERAAASRGDGRGESRGDGRGESRGEQKPQQPRESREPREKKQAQSHGVTPPVTPPQPASPPPSPPSHGIVARNGERDAALAAAAENGRQAAQTVADHAPAGNAADPARKARLENLAALRGQYFDLAGVADAEERKATWAKIVGKRGVKSALELTDAQLDELANNLKAKIDGMAAERQAREGDDRLFTR